MTGSLVLTWPTKGIWHEHRQLDTGRGCFATASTLASRVGLSPETVERSRTALVRAGLLIREGSRMRSTWYATVPPDLRPGSDRPTDAAVSAAAARLDAHLISCGYRESSRPDERDTSRLTERDTSRPIERDHSASSARGEGGQGGGVPLTTSIVNAIPASTYRRSSPASGSGLAPDNARRDGRPDSELETIAQAEAAATTEPPLEWLAMKRHLQGAG
ncbi:MAG: helix-turn-helix domain-containing protein [Gemmatimonadales bacterium]|nr:helix-turn-helix domain-containing protein [Gemmatimonadales bacterium]